MTKSEAIRRALAAGNDMAKDGVAYIRKTFGLVVSPRVYSAQKSKLAARSKLKGTVAQVKPKAATETRPEAKAKPETKATTPAKASLLEDVKRVKELVNRHGSGAVLEMVELFGK